MFMKVMFCDKKCFSILAHVPIVKRKLFRCVLKSVLQYHAKFCFTLRSNFKITERKRSYISVGSYLILIQIPFMR